MGQSAPRGRGRRDDSRDKQRGRGHDRRHDSRSRQRDRGRDSRHASQGTLRREFKEAPKEKLIPQKAESKPDKAVEFGPTNKPTESKSDVPDWVRDLVDPQAAQSRPAQPMGAMAMRGYLGMAPEP